MSSDQSRSARQLLQELRAAEAYVRVAAARVLPWPSMARMERRAAERCEALLTELGVAFGGPMPHDDHAPILPRPRMPAEEPPIGAPTLRAPTLRGESPSPAPRLVETISPEAASPDPTATPPRPARLPADPRPTAPRAKTTLHTAPQVEDLDDQLTVAAGPPKPRSRPAPRTPPPPPRQPAPNGLELSPPRDDDPLDQEPDTGLVSFELPPGEDIEALLSGHVSALKTPEPSPAPKAPAAAVAIEQTPPGPAQSRTTTPATSGLYGGGGVPAVRGAESGRPRAAAIQLNATGTGGKVLLDEEDEPIEVEEASHDLVEEGGAGFAVSLHEDEVVYEETPAPVPEREPEPEPVVPEEEPPSPDEIASLLAQAQSVAATGNLHGAAQLYSDVIDMASDNARAHVSRGRLYLDLGDYSRAMSDFMVAEDLAPHDPETHVAIGDLYFHRKEYRRAIDYFSSALEVSPEHAMAFCRRGICHYYRKNYRVALEDLLRAEDLQPDIPNIAAYVTRARKKAAGQRA